MALSTAEVQQCKHFLGYGNLLASAIPYFDVAIVFEDVIQRNLDTAWAEGYVRNTILANLLQLDIDIMSIRSDFRVTELVGDAKLNPKSLDLYLAEKQYWVNELSSTLKIAIAPPINGGGTMEMW